jgi:hypothetical protein
MTEEEEIWAQCKATLELDRACLSFALFALKVLGEERETNARDLRLFCSAPQWDMITAVRNGKADEYIQKLIASNAI